MESLPFFLLLLCSPHPLLAFVIMSPPAIIAMETLCIFFFLSYADSTTLPPLYNSHFITLTFFYRRPIFLPVFSLLPPSLSGTFRQEKGAGPHFSATQKLSFDEKHDECWHKTEPMQSLVYCF
ncbi:hypothetical protein OIU84_012756 [Salix udensis]|uniref:Secreted protein n=1 Tax=Salix udensis TaxID=889485 RepID=A0AAD6JIF1_9ROSI|nr:hypothetical protein OIU84_012756 [Salix udensis]